MTKTPRNYLKYWRVIRQYYKAKFGLSQADIDILLFMYSEGYFTKRRFDEFDRLVCWDKDRFSVMKRKGWFELFKASIGNKPAIYQMSDKAKLIVADIYRKLNGEELPMHNKRNPMLKRSAKYSEKIYIDMIVEMNSFIQQQRRRPLE
jgi:hypothetical protein